MDELLKIVSDNPEGVLPLGIASIFVNVWLARIYLKTQGQVVDFANNAGGAIAAANGRLEALERDVGLILEWVRRRGD